ncbi:MAG TPA: thioredoxin domain-containing protein [Actinomycetes bacterium]|jgi:hypothetical protein|nr:thioredoxin domain-containing protein [Actinomycetes bacterium]
MAEARRGNRLAGETSPYLLQHADNPVDWYPWGEEALERARREDKPILLSVGYAACHWCHVMAHESFEDPETAAVMNEHFVPVKVDREERPDLDGIYMDAVQAMTGQGGWPMTVFLTPDGGPFFAGTYFPRTDRHGLPGFRKVLLAVAEAWRERREDARRQGEAVVGHIAAQSLDLEPATVPLSEELLRQAFDGLRRVFDPRWGGFGPAPKFPQPMTLEFALRASLRGWEGALEMVELTLNRMALGGVYDQLGGGFHRYSTDGRWLVPHFEKMLYDNAQLVRVYTHAWQVTGWPRYRRIARETAGYLLRELRHPEGGFFSSQDADSEGVEGKFFVWSYDELVDHAGEVVADLFGATPEGNWEGTNVLWMPEAAEKVAMRHGLGLGELEQRWADGRRRLFEAREARVHPATDDKVLAAWNGLAISALAEAGRAFDEPSLVEAALAAAEFVLVRLRGPDGRLLRAWRDGRAGGPGYLDDYACMAEACLTLWETTFELRWLTEARQLADAILELFADPERGGFYQTGSDAERLVLRPRELFDNAVPSGSSVAADVLQRLARLTGETAYDEAAAGALRLVQDVVPRAPTGFGYALSAADFALSRVREVAIVGNPAALGTRALLDRVRGRYQPNQVLALAAQDDQEAAARVPLLADRTMVDGRATAYVCEHFVCKRPVTDPDELSALLD